MGKIVFDKERLKKIKLIVADLDGTLVDEKGELGAESKKVISQLKKNGIEFTIATGRLQSAVLGICKDLDITIPIITLDGSLIKNPITNEILYESFVPEKYVQKALKLSDKFLLNIALCTEDAIYYTENNSLVTSLLRKFGANYQEVQSYNGYTDRVLEIVMMSDYKENLRFVKDKFSFPYSFGLSKSYYRSNQHSEIAFLEIRKRGANKSKGMDRILKKLNRTEKEVAVIGDWYNDLSLFETKAFKVAIANAVPEIKQLSDLVLKKTNNEEGAIEFFEMLLKARNN
ncbi:MAG: hypothetical protein C0425_09220 [Chlorobiaceae bacterium]|nr:hypothetical protein [Chlorobiaceae bacterium]MBA4310502.1 hypothetical protein [Chlorobiaceae bacterium]